jgi:IS30 family transposase
MEDSVMVHRRWSEADKTEVWRRWKAGESLRQISLAFACTHPAVAKVLRRTGGRQPPPRRRAARVLSSAEREEISRGLAAAESAAAMGRRLGRHRSTITREVRRHGGRGAYRAATADAEAWRWARRPKRCRLAQRPRLARQVAAKLQADWSPEQIAGWLRRRYPDNGAMQVSHETIYRSLFVQSRGVLKQSLVAHLRRPRTMRRPRVPPRVAAGPIREAVSIHERPPTVEDRAVPGHWEGDLLSGTIDSHVATLVERQSRYVMLVRVPSKETTVVVRALARHIRRLPTELRRTLTWDRGRELAAHHAFSMATDVAVYFCDPHHPWQRGSNENTNGLLRQYLPRGTDFRQYSQADLNRIARRLNQRPRKTLGFETPADKLAAIVASTG